MVSWFRPLQFHCNTLDQQLYLGQTVCCVVLKLLYTLSLCTVLPALRANSCIAIDRLMIELLDFHIPFLSFTNAGFKGYGKNLLNRRLRITQLP